MTPTNSPPPKLLVSVAIQFSISIFHIYFAKFGALTVTFSKYIHPLKLVYLAKNQICGRTAAVVPFKSLSICHLNNPSTPPPWCTKFRQNIKFHTHQSPFKIKIIHLPSYFVDYSPILILIFCSIQVQIELTCSDFTYLKKSS